MRIHYVIIFFVFISCKTQKSQSEFDKCDFIVTENESDFDELVSNIDETIFYKNVLDRFEKLNKGILLYTKYSNHKYGKFILIEFTNNEMHCTQVYPNKEKNIHLDKSQEKWFQSNILLMEQAYYYENCKSSSDRLNLLIVKQSDSVLLKYFSMGELYFNKTSSNKNFIRLKEFLENTASLN